MKRHVTGGAVRAQWAQSGRWLNGDRVHAQWYLEQFFTRVLLKEPFWMNLL